MSSGRNNRQSEGSSVGSNGGNPGSRNHSSPVTCDFCHQMLDAPRCATANLPCDHRFHLDCIRLYFDGRPGELMCHVCHTIHHGTWLFAVDRNELYMEQETNNNDMDTYYSPLMNRDEIDLHNGFLQSSFPHSSHSGAIGCAGLPYAASPLGYLVDQPATLWHPGDPYTSIPPLQPFNPFANFLPLQSGIPFANLLLLRPGNPFARLPPLLPGGPFPFVPPLQVNPFANIQALHPGILSANLPPPPPIIPGQQIAYGNVVHALHPIPGQQTSPNFAVFRLYFYVGRLY